MKHGQIVNFNGVTVANSLTDHGIYIQQDGVLASSKYGLYIYSNVAQVNAALARINQDHASSTQPALSVNNDGTGDALAVTQTGVASTAALYVINTGTANCGYFYQNAVNATNKHGLKVYSNSIQTAVGAADALVRFHQDHASSTQGVQRITNDGTGQALTITQSGVLATGKIGLHVVSLGAQTGTATNLVMFQLGASSTADVLSISNSGSGQGLYIQQVGVLAASHYGLYVYSNAAQVNGVELFRVTQDNASSTAPVSMLRNDGSGICSQIYQNGNGRGIYLVNAGTQDGIEINQNGVLAASQGAIYLYSNVAQVNSALVHFIQDHASATTDIIYIQNDGSGRGVDINQIGDSAHIRLQGDPSNSVPSDGDIWFDGTNLKMRIGATTYNIDMTAV